MAVNLPRGVPCRTLLTLFLLLGTPWSMAADPVGIPAVTLTTGPDGEQSYSVTIQILFIMTALTLLPALLMMMTSFTRIIIVFAILRQALGLQQTPSNQILLGLALFLTLFIMSPVLEKVNETALQPYLKAEMAPLQAVQQAAGPFRDFMLELLTPDNSMGRRIFLSPFWCRLSSPVN